MCAIDDKDDTNRWFFDDNAGNNGKSEHTIRTEEVRISSEFVQLDNADVQDLKLEVKVLLNIVDV